MTLQEAIEILTSLERTLAPIMAASGTDAIKLGKEALAYIQKERYANFPHHIPLLRGETKE